MRGDLEQLRTFLKVANSGSFTSAAAERNTDVSAVSRAVQDLEATIGVVLFVRLPRGVRLTAAGRVYALAAQEILARYEQARLHARQAAAEQPLHLSVGYVWSVTNQPMVELLSRFSNAHGDTAVEIVEDGNDELLARLRSGRLDVAIAASDPAPLARLKPLGPLQSFPLWLEPIVALLPAHEEIDGVEWADLSGRALLCRTVDDWPRFVRHVERVGGPTLQFQPHGVSQEGVAALVAAGLGWALIPASTRPFPSDTLRTASIISAGAAVQVEAVWNPENANPTLSYFLSLCQRLYPLNPGSGEPSQSHGRWP